MRKLSTLFLIAVSASLCASIAGNALHHAVEARVHMHFVPE